MSVGAPKPRNLPWHSAPQRHCRTGWPTGPPAPGLLLSNVTFATVAYEGSYMVLRERVLPAGCCLRPRQCLMSPPSAADGNPCVRPLAPPWCCGPHAWCCPSCSSCPEAWLAPSRHRPFAVSTWMAESVMLWQAGACSHVCPPCSPCCLAAWSARRSSYSSFGCHMAQLLRMRRHVAHVLT